MLGLTMAQLLKGWLNVRMYVDVEVSGSALVTAIYPILVCSLPPVHLYVRMYVRT